ncbi:MAG TPA: TonB-dependent receptor [Vicinamibacterales bacterium]|nr:TonB-dependent receptor [Vicinamibacterales bacterium]
MRRSKFLYATTLTVLSVLFAAPPIFAERPPAPDARWALSGRALDSSGAAIPRATIVVRQRPSGLDRVVESGRDGRFVLQHVPRGTYLVIVSAPGFEPVEQVIDLPASETVLFTLSPAPIVEQVTVTSASRQDELRESLNTRVDVITRSRIEETGGHETVGEILREIPGVVTRRGSESAGAAGEQIQGVESRQVLVLVDGQPLVGARGIKRGGVLNLDRQSTARLERIEVVKGAASALYGSEALGGVINLITRQPSHPFEADVSLSGGSLGAVSARVDAGFRRDALFGLFSIERHQQDGFDLTPGTFDTTGAPFRRYDLLGKAEGRFTPSFAVGLTATGYSNETGGRSIGELGRQEDDIDDRAFSAGATADWLSGNTTVQMRAYVSSFRETSRGRLAPPASTPLEPGSLEERYLKTDVSIARTLGTSQHLQAGIEWSRDHYEGTNRVRDEASGHEVDTLVAWAQHRWAVTNRLTTTIGARVDRRSGFETAVSPKAAASFRITDRLYARASYGRGFRAPDLGQLFYRFLSPSNFYQVIGNPNLTPEYAHSWQVGGEYITPRRRARLGVNLFRNDIRDLIDSVSLGFIATPQQLAAVLAREGLDPSFRPALGRVLFTYRNVSDAVTQGAEIDGEAALTRTLSVGGAYTYLSARDGDTGLDLTGRHPHHGHVRISWQPPSGFRASLRGTFFSSWIAARSTANGAVNDTVAPRFALWDAFVSQRIGRQLSLFVSVENIADSQDPNTGVLRPDGTPAPIYRPEAGRTARVGVQWSFTGQGR